MSEALKRKRIAMTLKRVQEAFGDKTWKQNLTGLVQRATNGRASTLEACEIDEIEKVQIALFELEMDAADAADAEPEVQEEAQGEEEPEAEAPKAQTKKRGRPKKETEAPMVVTSETIGEVKEDRFVGVDPSEANIYPGGGRPEAAAAPVEEEPEEAVLHEAPPQALQVRGEARPTQIAAPSFAAFSLLGPEFDPRNVDGADDRLRASGVSFPVLKLVQRGPEKGKWKNMLTEELAETAEVTYLSKRGRNALMGIYDPSAAQQRRPYCVASRGLQRDGGEDPNEGEIAQGAPVPPPLGTPCSKCPHSKWGKDRKPPRCTEGYLVLCWDHRAGMPTIAAFRRSSVKELKALEDRLDVLCYQHGEALQAIPPQWRRIAFRLSIAVKEINANNKDFFVPVSSYKDFALLDEKALADLAPIAAPLVKQFVEVRELDDVDEAEEDLDGMPHVTQPERVGKIPF